MFKFYAAIFLILVGIGTFVASKTELISFLVGMTFGGINFYFTLMMSSTLLFKKGVANPRMLIVIKLLFLMTGLGLLTVFFRDSIAWISGGFLFFLTAMVFYFLLEQRKNGI